VGLENIKERLGALRESCLESLSKTLEYSLDWQSTEDDFSREYAFNELLYNYQAYKRALDNFPKIIDETAGYIEKNIKETIIDLSETDFKSNYQIFLSEYYSKERYTKILKNIYDITLSNLDAVDNKTEEKVQEYFLIKDRFNLFAQSLSFFEDIDNMEISISDTIRSQYDILGSDLQTVFDEYKCLWQYFAHSIKDQREVLLVPNTSKYAEWFEIVPLTATEIESIFSNYAVSLKQNQVLSNIVDLDNINNLFNRNDRVAGKHIDQLIGTLREVSSDFDDMLSNVFNQPRVQPAFATYSKSNKIEDIDLSEIVTVISRNSKLLDTLVEEIENYEKQEGIKKELLIMSYLLFQEDNKAKKISGEEE